MNLTIEIIAVLCAFIIKGMCGFANTLIFGTIMSFAANNINITPMELLVGYPSNIYIVWKERKEISPKVCIPLALLVLAGIIPGMLFLKHGNAGFLKVLFGLVVILSGIDLLLREKRNKAGKQSKLALAFIGVISGIFCGLFGVGALLVAYISRTTENQRQFRGNICAVFLIENTFRIILYSLTGIFSLAIFRHALLLLPFMFLGLIVGGYLSGKTGEKRIRRIVIILLILSGISLILTNL